MKKVSINIILFLLILCPVLAQQDPQFSQYYFNNAYLNAGYNGLEHVSRATLIHRSQWLGYQSSFDDGGAPTTQALTLSHPISLFDSKDPNSGAGLVLVHDQLGPQRNITANASFSYHVPLKIGGNLGLGLRAGIYSQSIDVTKFRTIDEENFSDVSSFSQVKPDLSFGAFYKTNTYYAGIAFNHLIASRYNFGEESLKSKLARHMYINGGYDFHFGGALIITPTALIQTDFSETNYDIGVIGSLNKFKYWGGITLRQSFGARHGDKGVTWRSDDFVILIGMSFLEDKETKTNTLRVGYAFDMVTSGLRAKNPTSHEIMISYVLPFSSDQGAPPVHTPRYRHEN